MLNRCFFQKLKVIGIDELSLFFFYSRGERGNDINIKDKGNNVIIRTIENGSNNPAHYKNDTTRKGSLIPVGDGINTIISSRLRVTNMTISSQLWRE